MKRILLFLVPVLFVTVVLPAQQAPWLVIDNYTNSSSTVQKQSYNDVFGPSDEQHPVRINNTAQEEHLAGNRIVLRPGFQAANFSGNGNYRAHIGAAPEFEVVFIEPNAHYPLVPRFEKLELGVKLPVAIEQRVNDYLNNINNPLAINPFDPERINIVATFSKGNTVIQHYGFYFEDFHRNTADLQGSAIWEQDPTDYRWRIRFSPPETGVWKCEIKIYLYGFIQSAFEANNIYFECIPSANPGYVEIGQDNRHLRFSASGQTFFPLGQNISWPDNSVWRGNYPFAQNNFYGLYSTGILDIYDYMENLADNGGNFVRVITTPELWEIEWGGAPVNYRMEHAWELDRLFDLCESKGLYLLLNPDFQGKYIYGNDPDDWDDNPYNNHSSINIPEDLFLANNQADTYKWFRNRMRYYMARWGYSTQLAIFQFFSEQDNWKFQTELVNNQNMQQEMYDLQDNLAKYIKQMDVGKMHLLSSTLAKNAHLFTYYNVYDIPEIDITSTNKYNTNKGMENSYYEILHGESQINPFDGNFYLWDKPSMLSEIGIFAKDEKYVIGYNPDGTPIEVPLADPNDIDFCDDINFHNNLWATSFFGAIGPGNNWWQWFNNDFRQDNFPAIRTFFDAVGDFESLLWTEPGNWKDASINLGSDYYKHVKIENFYLKTSSHDHAIGWCHNATNYWGNRIQNSCFDRNSLNMPLPDDDDTQWNVPQNIGNLDVGRVEGMNWGRYLVQRYATRGTGGPIGLPIHQFTDIFGRLELNWVSNLEDFAYKADRDPFFHAPIDSITTPTNTIHVCLSDSITANGTFLEDSIGLYNYYWTIDSIFYSANHHPVFHFTTPGVYLIGVIVSDSSSTLLHTDQFIIVDNCNNDSVENRNQILNSDFPTKRPGVSVFPNPTFDGNFAVMMDSGYFSSVTINIFTADGKLILNQQNTYTEPIQINLSNYQAGLFLLDVVSDKKTYHFKIINVK